jgi:tetratricopeptide (TPR) repeat protein
MAKSITWTWKNVELAKDLEESLQRGFQVDILNAQLENDPQNVDYLMELGNLYTLLGRVGDGLKVDIRLVELKPQEPLFHYNLACSQSLLGEIDASLDSLKRAIEHGYTNLEYLKEDSDLENVRQDRRFQGLVELLGRLRRQRTEKRRLKER